MARKLSPKQQLFVDQYLVDLNATQAAIRAGYSERTANEQAGRLLVNVSVASAIAAAMKSRSERIKVNADYVLNRMIEIDKMDVLDIMDDEMQLKPVSQWPKVWRQYLNGFDLAEMFEGTGEARQAIGVLKKIKWPDKVKNLELLGRHFGMFNDKLALTGGDGGPVVIDDRTAAAKVAAMLATAEARKQADKAKEADADGE